MLQCFTLECTDACLVLNMSVGFNVSCSPGCKLGYGCVLLLGNAACCWAQTRCIVTWQAAFSHGNWQVPTTAQLLFSILSSQRHCQSCH